MDPHDNVSALRRFILNLKAAPRLILESAVRTGLPRTDRSRASFVFENLFLHLHPVRVHRWTLRWSTTWGLGILCMVCFLLTLLTGLLLMFYYKPYPDVAYQSIKDIHFVVPTGQFIRNIHRWAANLMVVGVFLHMARVFYTAAYRPPREFNWLVGMGLLILTLGLSYSGYLLPWDQLAYWATTIGANVAQSPREVTDALGITEIIDIGGIQRELLLGSDVVGEEALIRFYVLHVMLLPMALGVLMAVHFWRIRKDGGLAGPVDAEQRLGTLPSDAYPVFTQAPMKTYQLVALVKGKAPRPDSGPENTVPSMPHLFYAELAVLMFTTLICVGLSLWMDAPLKELANPNVLENPARAPWYFLGLQELVSFSAFMGGIGIPALVVVGLGLIPYLEREQEGTGVWFGGPGGGRLVMEAAVFGLTAVSAVEALAISQGWLREWFLDIHQLVVTLFNPGTLIAGIYALYSVLVVKRFNSTRAGAMALFTCFLCRSVVLTIIGAYFRGPNWEFYWSPSQWPSH